jgi:hypothetical protein
MRLKITIEDMDEFRSNYRAELTITKNFWRLCEGEIDLTIEDSKVIIDNLKQIILK